MRKGLPLLILILLAPLSQAHLAVSGFGYHSEGEKRVIYYTNSTDGIVTLKEGERTAATFQLASPVDNEGSPVTCQGGQRCLVADFTDYKIPGTYRFVINNDSSTEFTISDEVYNARIPLFLSYFDATSQQNSSFHGDLNSDLAPSFPYMADGSFILESHQAAFTLMRLGSAYRRNPSLFQSDLKDYTEYGGGDLAEHILRLARYLRALQGVQLSADPNGFRVTTAVKIKNAFTPGPNNLTSLEVYIPNNPPTLLEVVPVSSLCGADDNSSDWDECVARAARVYKCQESEVCLDVEYNDERKGLAFNDVGFGVSRGWGYEFGCFNNINLSAGGLKGQNPCMVFQEESSRESTAEALLAFLLALPAIQDVDAEEASHYLGRAIATEKYLREEYSFVDGGDDAALYGASLFLLFDATNNASYLKLAHALRDSVPATLISDRTRGREYYWQFYIEHEEDIALAALPYTLPSNPLDIFRGKMYYDWKDRGALSVSQNAERVYQLDPSIRFSNSRFILTEGVLAEKSVYLGAGEAFIPVISESQLAWLTGMNSVQQGVHLGAPVKSMSFIFGIGDFPAAQHTRLLVSMGVDQSGAFKNPILGVRGTGLQFFNGSDYFYLDGRFNILGVELGALGNGYQNETRIKLFKENQSYNNGLSYIPGWINGPFDVDDGGEYDKVFNYADDVNSYEYTETTNEMVATALEFIAYIDARMNNVTPHPGVNVSPGEVKSRAVVCYNSAKTLPATCSGNITSDSFNGCRSITCNNKTILACDKKGFFEMYNQGGPTNIEICIGKTCIDDEGYAASTPYPVCLGGVPQCTDKDNDSYSVEGGACGLEDCADGNASINPSASEECNGADDDCDGYVDEGGVCSVCGNNVVEEGESCDDGNLFGGDGCDEFCQPEANSSAALKQQKWFPQGNNTVLVCVAVGFQPSSYDFVFGDGSQQLSHSENNVWHAYPGPGNYTASCTARGGGESPMAKLNITIA